MERVVPFNLAFNEIIGLSQRVGNNLASQALVSQSYALGFRPSGLAPNYTFMSLIHCLYGEKAQKTVSRNLAQYILDLLDRPKFNARIANPNKDTIDWVGEASKTVAVGSIVVAEIAKGALANPSDPNGETVQEQLRQSAYRALQINAQELARISETVGTAEDRTSLYAILKDRAFPLTDFAMSETQKKRMNDLLASLPQ